MTTNRKCCLTLFLLNKPDTALFTNTEEEEEEEGMEEFLDRMEIKNRLEFELI